MDILKTKYTKSLLCFAVAFLMLLGSFFAFSDQVYAASGNPADNGSDIKTLQPSEKAGLVFMGEKIKGNKGFSNDMFYLSETQTEALKTAHSTSGTGLGDSYVKDKIYSSYENHGSGAYHYSRAEGLEIDKMFDAVVDGGAPAVTNYFVVAGDGYTQNISRAGTAQLKYYAPGNTVGELSALPMIALYRSANTYEDQTSGRVPATAARLGAEDNTLIFGQTDIMDSNNCKFLHGANIISVNKMPAVIRSDSSKVNGSIPQFLQKGIYKTQYSFLKNGSTVTHKVEGVPLSFAADDMGLSALMPDFADYSLRIESADGSTKEVSKEDIDKCFVAWSFTDGMATPSEQTGAYMIYMPGSVEADTVAYDVSKLNVVSKAGQVVTSKAAKPGTPAKLTASSGGCDRVKLAWNKVNGADGYYIYQYDAKTKEYKKVKDLAGNGTVSYTKTGLKTGSRYYYRMTAYKTYFGDKIAGDMTSGQSAVPVPAKPSLKLGKSGSRAIKISWNKVRGADGYQIYRAAKKSEKYSKIKTVTSGNTVKYTNKNLKKGKKYYYKVRAYSKIKGKNVYGSFSAIKSLKR